MAIKKIFLALGKLEKMAVVGAALVFILALSVKTALYINANTKLVAAEGGTFREGIVGQPVFINPIMPTTNADREMAKIIFGSVSDIIETVKHSENGKTWNVRIKQNVFWHDGEPLTSDDIIFTLATIADREARSPLAKMFEGVSAERISELEVKFMLQSTYVFFEEEHLRNLSVIPKHIFGDLPVQNFKLSIYGLKPVGFGPYKIDSVNSYEKDDRGVINAFHLNANENYIGGAPHITNFVFRFYKDEDELISAYNANKIDGLLLGTSHAIQGVTSRIPEETPLKIRHKEYDVKSSRYYAVFINQALTDKNLKNIKVREAMSKSIDRAAMANDVFGDKALPLYGPTALTASPSPDYSADALQGVKLNITLPEEDFLIKTAGIIKATWEKLGAEVNLIVLPLTTITDKTLKNTDYELLLLGNTLGSSNDLFSFWHSSKRFYPDQNLSLYQRKQADAMLEAYRKSFDEEARQENLKKISDMIAMDYPAVFLYSPDYVYIATPNLAGFVAGEIMNMASDRFRDIEKWYVKTKRVF